MTQLTLSLYVQEDLGVKRAGPGSEVDPADDLREYIQKLGKPSRTEL